MIDIMWYTNLIIEANGFHTKELESQPNDTGGHPAATACSNGSLP